MGPKMECDHIDTLLELKHHLDGNVTKTEISPKLKCHQNWNVVWIPLEIYNLLNNCDIVYFMTECTIFNH